MRKIRVGSRDSKLAIDQTKLVMDAIAEGNSDIELELITMKTTGDKILDKTLDKVGGKGLFVKELDDALRSGQVDITVHSLKDMPMEVPEDLPLLAFFKRGNPYDAIVLPEGKKDEKDIVDAELPLGSSSRRRALQIMETFPGKDIKPVRGNVLTRLRKLDDGEYSALMLASSGLERLGLQDRISRVIKEDEVIPAAGQGTLVVQGRAGEDYSFLDVVDDEVTRLESTAERAFVSALDGGCSSPIGGFARVEGTKTGGRLRLWGFYAESDESRSARGYVEREYSCEQDIVDAARQLAFEVKNKTGKVYLVGAGPGDPGLFTLRGREVLAEADTVVYDKLVGPGVLAMIPEKAKLIDVGKVAGAHPVPQWRINEILCEEALRGRRVVRLKGGDPFVFGRGGEEIEKLLECNVDYEVVPGITSAVAVPAYNGIPVTHRDFSSSFHVITGHTKSKAEAEIDYEALVRLDATLIFLMGVGSMDRICRGLIDAGMDENMPAAALEKGTTAHQRRVVATVSTLYEEATKAKIGTPTIIIVGRVCSLSDDFAWYENRQLAGIKVAVTRPQNRASTFADKLRNLGAEVLMVPAIKTVAIPDNKALDEAIEDIEKYTVIGFTSPYGVKVFFDRMLELGVDIRKLAGIKFAAIGEGTRKAIEEKGIMVDLMPEKYSGGDLGGLLAEKCRGEKILIPRAAIGTDAVVAPLREAGIDFLDLPVYETEKEVRNIVGFEDDVDMVAFTSASTVRSFISANPELDCSKVKAVCIGEQTAEQARKAGMKVYVSDEATIDSLVDAVIAVVGAR